jgi:hypothetical protein
MNRDFPRETKPRTELTLKQAVRSLTGFEFQAIKKNTGMSFRDADMLTGHCVIYALENREGKVPWTDVGKMSVQEVEDYFTDEDEAPDSDQENFTEPVN